MESAIRTLITRMSDPGQGQLYVKVALDEKDPEDAETLYGELFLSMPYIGADRERLANIMAHVRENYDGDERFEMVVGEDEEYASFRDEEAQAVLLNLISSLTVTAR